MGESQTPHFYDFGISGRVPQPQNQYYLSFETPGYLTEFKKNPTHCFENIMFININILKIPNSVNFGKDVREIPPIRLINS